MALSSPDSLRITHALRSAHAAILVGIGTVLADDPQLTVRLVDGPNPQPIVVDSHLRFPAQARLRTHPKGPWLAHVAGTQPAATSINTPGTQLLAIPPDQTGRVDLDYLFTHLGGMGVQSIMVEGGARIIGSLLAQGLANFAVLTVVPRFAEGRRIPLAGLAAAGPNLVDPTYIQAGQDIVIWGEISNTTGPVMVPPAPPATAAPSV